MHTAHMQECKKALFIPFLFSAFVVLIRIGERGALRLESAYACASEKVMNFIPTATTTPNGRRNSSSTSGRWIIHQLFPRRGESMWNMSEKRETNAHIFHISLCLYAPTPAVKRGGGRRHTWPAARAFILISTQFPVVPTDRLSLSLSFTTAPG